MCVLELGSHDIVSFSILFLLAANVEGLTGDSIRRLKLQSLGI